MKRIEYLVDPSKRKTLLLQFYHRIKNIVLINNKLGTSTTDILQEIDRMKYNTKKK